MGVIRYACVLILISACSGEIGGTQGGAFSGGGGPSDPTRGPTSGPVTPGTDTTQSVGSAIPRLSRREIEAVIVNVFGVSGLAIKALPPEPDVAINPRTSGEETIFDTFAGTLGEYVPSEVFIQGIASLAYDVAEAAAGDRPRLEAIAGCTPTGESDSACMAALIDEVGLRVFRRPLNDEERGRLAALGEQYSSEGGFFVGARAVIQSLIQSPDFVYRTEIGSEMGDGLHELDNFELISKLSFLFWGAPPSNDLLERAAGEPIDESELASIVQTMADDQRTDDQIHKMHAMWLRYEAALVNDSGLRNDMLVETEALLERVLGDPTRPWSELFTSDETYVSARLATHYGMREPSAGRDWVSYDNPERAGILSHGSFLSLSATRGNETLPSRRGAIIARQLLCRSIPPPPPDVDVDDGVEVPAGECKFDAYEAHRQAGSSCAGCHALIDPIGFGFERFDGLGAYRTVERDNPSCQVDGVGDYSGTPFSGPREFVEASIESGDLTECATQQLMRFSLRRALNGDDRGLLERLHGSFTTSGEDFRKLLVQLASDPSFRFRREK